MSREFGYSPFHLLEMLVGARKPQCLFVLCELKMDCRVEELIGWSLCRDVERRRCASSELSDESMFIIQSLEREMNSYFVRQCQCHSWVHNCNLSVDESIIGSR